MFKNPLGKKKYIEINVSRDELMQDIAYPGKYTCSACSSSLSEAELLANNWVCPRCNFHFALTAGERIVALCDDDSFVEFNQEFSSRNILGFPGYEEKLVRGQQETGFNESVITGIASVGGFKTVLGVMESHFMMASMGVVAGEKICRAAEMAINEKCPLIMVAASGGARMQEGMVSLMQMTRTSTVIGELHRQGILFISLLTNPTTGGVLASFASLADIIIAEPGALIGFAGPRVIQQTIRQQMPERFQRAEFLLEHGMLDMVVERTRLKETLATLLAMHVGGK
ncbi:MAG: acetyl-CoA carboxylase, carboxyltransferase subunit beta [Deltaproteobacteria bacterium]